MDWYLNRALTNFRNEVNERWPNRDKKSDGTIGDAAHQASKSDHNPDPDGSVDAWDMDVDGVDVWACINAALQHESIQYVIYNRKITSRSWGLGIWHDYTGPSPHTEHVHYSTRDGYENSTKPWFKEEDDMNLDDPITVINDGTVQHTDSKGQLVTKLSVASIAAQNNYYAIRSDIRAGQAVAKAAAVEAKVDALTAKLDALKPTATGDVTISVSDEQLERVLRKIVGSVDEQ